jgi:UDP-glucose 4-epimerase
MKKILVTGGLGYIGSHTVVDLINKGYEVISVDNLINSFESVSDSISQVTGKDFKNYEIDLCDKKSLRKVFEAHEIDSIIHFAALKSVEESVKNPLRYFHNNIDGLLNTLDLAYEYKVGSFIFSSSCTVYGNPKMLPVLEDMPFGEAESPYGRTKQMGENIINDLVRSHEDMRFVILRYFNPAGAHESGLIGENAKLVAANLVPVITQVAKGIREHLTVFGDDYSTRDGSCVRDYIHVMDLAAAHTLAMEYLQDHDTHLEVFNLGIGQGVTVLEAIQAFENVAEQKLNYRIGPRRPGDVIEIYANYDKAKELLKWEPKRRINEIMRTAWMWQNKIS